MEESHLCLTWNDHGVNYQQELAYLRNDNILTDVTLACDGRKLLAHKLVLATCSDFFKSILGDVPCHHPIVYLRGVDGKVMEALLDFMYVGRIEFPKENLNSLLSTAQSLQIKSLGVMSKDQKNRPQENPSSKRKRSGNSYQESNQAKTSSSHCSEKSNLNIECAPKCQCHRTNNDIEIVDTPREFTPTSLKSFTNKENVDSYNGTLDSPILSTLFTQKTPSQSSNVISTITDDYHSAVNTTFIGHSNRQPSQLESNLEPPKSLPNFDEIGYPYATKFNSIEEDDKLHVTFPNEVKEEPLDCSQGSTLERVESQSSTSVLRQNILFGKDVSEREIIQETNQQDILEKYSRVSTTSHLPQDENLENGIENGRPYACPICQKSFAKTAILKRHHLAHFRPYSCHICPRSFTRREVLAEHVLEHNGADLRLPCPVCNMTIKRKRNLQAHIKVKHPDYLKQKSSNKTVV